MAKVERLREVQAALKRTTDKYGPKCSVVVGFQTGYALYVHENLEAQHPVGQAKYLEQPARRLMRELADMITGNMRHGLSLAKSLLIAGLRLQREAQLLVPVDTGALKNSAFTQLEEGHE